MNDPIKQYRIEEYVIGEEPFYVPNSDEVEIFEAAYRQRIPVLLKGPTGTGKTRFVEYMAWKLGRPLTVVKNTTKQASHRPAINGAVPLVTVACHGEIKPEGVKQALPPERLKVWEGKLKDSKQGVPFVTIRVEDPELVTDLERAGINFKGEVINDWLPTVLSWVVPVVLFVLLWNFLFKRMGPSGGMSNLP